MRVPQSTPQPARSRVFISTAIAISLLNLISFAPSTAAVPHQLILDSSAPASTQSKPKLVSDDVLEYLEDVRNRWQIKGAGFAVVKQDDDGNWQTETFGLGERDGKGNPVDENSLFGIASNSKLFTAFQVGLAVYNETQRRPDSPYIDWSTKVKEIVPVWKLMDPVASEQTDFVDLLSHRTGLPRHDLSYDAHATKEHIISTMRYLKPSTGFRQTWQYNNIAYLTASSVSEYLYGLPFTDYVAQNIWQPLGMHQTTYNPDLARSSGYRSDGFARMTNGTACARDVRKEGKVKLSSECSGEVQNIGWAIEDWVANAGAGGVITCPKDMAIWLKALLLEGRSPKNNETVIPPEIVKKAATGYTVPSGASSDPEMSIMTYGMGQEMYQYRGHSVVSHGGSVPGQMSDVWRLPKEKIGVVALVNDNEFGTIYHQLAIRRIVDHLLGLEPVEWEKRLLQKTFSLDKPAQPERPRNGSKPTDGYASLIGTYRDGAYGTLELCPLERTFNKKDLQSYQPTDNCKSMINKLHFTEQNKPEQPPTFAIPIDKVWANALLLKHFDGDLFNMTAAMTYSTNATFPEVEADATVKFGEGGVGLTGIWGAGATVQPQSGDMEKHGIRKGSEVFFVKEN